MELVDLPECLDLLVVALLSMRMSLMVELLDVWIELVGLVVFVAWRMLVVAVVWSRPS